MSTNILTTPDRTHSREILQRISHRAMLARGLAPEFSPAALLELEALKETAFPISKRTRDLRHLLWCSIDNDDSHDLDQVTASEALTGGSIRLLVAIADVGSLVWQGSAIDAHARQNTTSVYTAGQIFPMLPEKLSTNLSSLNPGADRAAFIVDMVISPAGVLADSDIYPAIVRNRAQLTYDHVAAWLDGMEPVPMAVSAVAGLAESILRQNRITCQLANLRHEHGALTLQTMQAKPVFEGSTLVDLVEDKPNSAKRLIEDVMIAANGVTARFLAAAHFPSLRRVVRVPKHWNRICEIALEHGTTLPAEADSKALETFLVSAKRENPVGFPDLSLTIIKLLGSGEYVLELPGATSAGHFGLALRDYSHSTAPNRRFPDLITERLLRAAISGRPSPYSTEELAALATHCTLQEDAAKKVERQVGKSAAALLLGPRIGENFEALVTGVNDQGTWVRLLQPIIEGKLHDGTAGLRVGDRLRVKLVGTDVERGFIDFSQLIPQAGGSRSS